MASLQEKSMTEGETKRALYIGRFQPFHKGHEDTILQMARAEDIDQIIVGIGSSQYGNYFGNPFTAGERTDFIKRAFPNQNLEVVEIPDIHDFPKWAPYVESLTPKFEVVYSGNTVVKDLFEKRGYEVRVPIFNFNISSTLIRNSMVEGRPWQDLVPDGTRDVLEEVDGAKRVRRLHNKYVKANITADLIVENEKGEIALIDRLHDPFENMPAIPGGYLNAGLETTMEAAIREAREEIGLVIGKDQVKYLGVYDEPGRDPRGPTISHVYYTRVSDFKPKAGDDAKRVYWVNTGRIPDTMAFDHRKILDDYHTRSSEK